MLTAFLAGFYFLYNYAFSIRWRRVSISAYAYSGAIGVVTGFFAFFTLSQSTLPSHQLNLSSIIHSQPNTIRTVALNEIDSRDINYNIPTELYPDVSYIAREPIMIASTELAVQQWGGHLEESSPIPATEKANQPKIAVAPKPEPKAPAPPAVGLDHVIQPGENLWDLAKAYGISFNKMMYYNQDINPRRIHVGQKVFIPGVKDPLPPKSKTMVLPLASVKYVTSGYGYRTHPMGGGGRFHKGVDIAAKSGTSVRAVLDGKVVYSGYKGQMGNTVEIEHDDGLITIYGHNRRLRVKAGQRVRQGQTVAEVGSTGRSTAPHLHFEVWKDGKHKDPLKGFLPRTMKYKYKSLARRY